MSEIVMRDVTRAGRELGTSHLTDLPTTTTLVVLLEARVRAEVARYNDDPGRVFVGLVQPRDSVRHSDGFRMTVPRPLHVEGALTAAREAVEVGMLGFELGGRRLTDLADEIAVDEHDEIVAVLERPIVSADL